MGSGLASNKVTSIRRVNKSLSALTTSSGPVEVDAVNRRFNLALSIRNLGLFSGEIGTPFRQNWVLGELGEFVLVASFCLTSVIVLVCMHSDILRRPFDQEYVDIYTTHGRSRLEEHRTICKATNWEETSMGFLCLAAFTCKVW